MSQNPFPAPEPARNEAEPEPYLPPVAVPLSGYNMQLPQDTAFAPRRQRSRKGLLIGGGIAAVLIVGLGGGAAWAMNSHGDYAYKHIAAGATAYAQLNMAPSMMEQVQAASFLAKLPKVDGKDLKDKAESPTSVAKVIVDGIAPDNKVKDYSWAGSRYAVALYGDLSASSISSSPVGDGGVILLQVTDVNKAVTVLNSALAGKTDGPNQVKAIGGDYVAVGTSAGIAKATTGTAELSDDASFNSTYEGAGDPLSYWYTADKQVATGSVRADWGSLKLTAKTTGGKLAVSDQAQAANKSLTAANSVANPYVNVGLADPKDVLGPDSPTGKALLSAAGAATGGSESAQLKTAFTTLLSAIGDNVSFSANDKSGRILLHGATEASVNAALTQLSGQPVTLSDLSKAYGGESNLQVQSAAGGLEITYGPNSGAVAADFSKVKPGIIVAKIELDPLLAGLDTHAKGKWGTIELSQTGTSAGTQTDASWDLP